MNERYVCIHGHFYQPPRENPWLEEIEQEHTAAPRHDWNERISAECYAPNAAARILDDKGRITELVNNYERMSFNFGPTLLRWMERHSPVAYRSILDADKASVERLGHGNAIAQVYNHIILPLANRRDKQTQVVWGLADFEHRFGRKSEGIWLAETAVDKETLEVLADNDVRYTILSPHQAKRYRMLEASSAAGAWRDVEDGSIPTGRAYLYQQHDGRPVHLFFYDGDIARGIAFERMLSDASHLVGAIDHGFTKKSAPAGEPWLVHTATDGESYGHHFAHGDMALAAAFRRLDSDPRTELVNYGAFLSRHPLRAEADIKPVSAWSCAHGVGRWSRDCGCRIGGGPGWTQRWREPLRAALDLVRDRLADHYERQMDELVRDPWLVRDRYIDVILDPSRADAFVGDNAKRRLSDDEVVRFFSLLEMQRAALLMYTSCGWFFDDVSGGESIILLKYAARALELAQATGERASHELIEGPFLAALDAAESNLSTPQQRISGKTLFLERARSVRVTAQQVAVSYALRALTEGARHETQLYAYRIRHHEEVPLTKGAVPCVFGRITVEDTRTQEPNDLVYALAHFGGVDFRCSVKPYTSDDELLRVKDRVRRAALLGSTSGMMRALDDLFGVDNAYTLKDAFADLRESAARTIGRDKLSILVSLGEELLENHRPLLLSLAGLGVQLPPHVATLCSAVLSRQAEELVRDFLEAAASEDDVDTNEVEFAWSALSQRLKSVVEEAGALGAPLDVTAGARALGDGLLAALERLDEERSPERVRQTLRLVDAGRVVGLAPRLWELQTALFRLVERARSDEALAALLQAQHLLSGLDELCSSAFAGRLVR